MSKHTMTRREAMRLIAGAPLVAGAAGFPGAAFGADMVKCINVGFVLGIHCPPTYGVLDECPKFGLQVEMQRLQSLRVILQTIMGGTGDIGVGEPIQLLRSRQAGNDLVMFGNWYLNTSLVVAVNTNYIQTWKDLEKPDVTVGINSQGDITQVMIIGGFLKAGGDLSKVKWADVGGSGTRMRALLGNRVQATVVHFDQMPEIQKTGNYKVILVPHREYHPWINEIVFARGDWLRNDANRRKAAVFMKGVIVASRRATVDFAYYKTSFLKYATLKGKDTMPESEMRAYWKTLAQDIGMWPADNAFRVANIEKLLPYYRAAKAIEDKPIDLAAAIDTSIMAQVLKELGQS
ncbi:MAG: ABC transporter substrate-binding protein [Betaproteobacteria bacterium]|nr:ABC transporter substrate-binding protein [Betaproteobacteria bacterium]